MEGRLHGSFWSRWVEHTWEYQKAVQQKWDTTIGAWMTWLKNPELHHVLGNERWLPLHLNSSRKCTTEMHWKRTELLAWKKNFMPLPQRHSVAFRWKNDSEYHVKCFLLGTMSEGHLVVQNTVFFSELLTCIFRQPTFQCSRSIEDTAKVDVKPAVKSSQQSWCFRNPAFTNQLRLVDYPIIYKVLFIQTVGCEWDLSPTQLAVFSSLYTVYIHILPSFGGYVIPPVTRKSIDKGIQSPGNFAFFPYWRWLKNCCDDECCQRKKESKKQTDKQTDKQTSKQTNKQTSKQTNEGTNERTN